MVSSNTCMLLGNLYSLLIRLYGFSCLHELCDNSECNKRVWHGQRLSETLSHPIPVSLSLCNLLRFLLDCFRTIQIVVE